jgi:MFS family permease
VAYASLRAKSPVCFIGVKEIWGMGLRVLSSNGFYGWINLGVMFFFNIAVMLMMLSFALFLPSWVDEFFWNRGDISWAQTVGMILSGLAAPMVGVFIMKKGAKRAVLIGNLLCVAGLIMLAYQNHIWQLFLGHGILIGLGMGIGGMLAMMTVINNWFIMKRPMALAVSMASMGFGGVVFNPVLIMLIDTIGWRNTYLFIAAAVFVFCVVVPQLLLVNKPEDLGQVPDGPAVSKSQKEDPSSMKHLYKTPIDFTAREALRTKTMWLLVGYGTLQFLVMGALMTHQFNFLLDISVSRSQAALATGIFGAVMGISQLGVGFLALKFEMHSLAVASIVIGIVGYVTLLFVPSLRAGNLFGGAIAYNVILGIGFGIQSIAMGNLIPDYFGRTEFPKMMGYTMPFTTFLSSFGSPVAGYIRERMGSYIFAFQLSLAIMIVAFFCIILAKPPVHPSLEKSHA